MRYSVAAAAAMASLASASIMGTGSSMPDVVTEVMTNFETYCPSPTSFTYGTQTYTMTAPGTLTFTEPCTVTRTLTSSTATECSSWYEERERERDTNFCSPTAPAPTSAPTGGIPGTGAPVPVPAPTGGSTSIYTPPTYPNSTAQAPPMGTASGTGVITAPLPTYTGAASRAVVGAGAGLAGLLGLAALLL
ncbi:GPI anchored serine-threonine rich protein [Trichophyton benhamiae CBS 112371]|uniref:GPI anchored serine-threonine rich protein n=1 Tax=Arthroderma benhamiae (strain ATCC MYA-4681 / CBS 112371) TaxID=663331 RepID=D4AU66_ARTBC|nr:GPI anchored serine-threonine rich protein [Trichophyton benhamiae CBS 112371]EFE33336.1 GPI anchored serine-threonine rich protein [Trichophyton benhamiae CBS 112371]